jgi:hypothetical protein
VTDVLVDPDGDGLGDADEAARGTDPRQPDTDGDGLPDGFEVRHGLAPLDPHDGLSDPDGDGLTTLEEQDEGTDPRNPDTDGDGVSDGDEIHVYRTDPTRADTDEDGLTDGDEVLLYDTDPLDADSDGDGVRDGIEIAAGSDPLEPRSVPTAVVYGLNTLQTELLVLNPDTGQAFAIGNIATDLQHLLRHTAWSPDGRTLYAQGEAGLSVGLEDPAQLRLHTVDPDTGVVLTTVVVSVDQPITFLTSLVADANGAVLAAVSFGTSNNASDLWRLDPATGGRTRLGSTGSRLLAGLAFTPDFRTLYAITGLQIPPVLLTLDPATAQATPIARTDLPTRAESMAFTADGRLLVAGGDGNLYELDAVTGAATLLGPMGVGMVSGMSQRVLR